MARSELYLGLDFGTQSLRAALYDAQGTCHGFGVEPIETTHPRPAWAEQDPFAWRRALKSAIPKALASASATPDQVAAIGLDATACTVVACSKAGESLRPALLWMDQRSFAEAREASESRDDILRYVSGVVSPEWMIPKACWLKRNEHNIYHAADRIVECTDLVMYWLTGQWTLSLNNVTVKWNYARPDGGWSRSLLRSLDIDDIMDKWPAEIVPLGAGNGILSQAASREFGLKAGTPVAQGGIDAYLGMIGLGATNPGDLAMIIGSSTCHLMQSQREILGSGLLGCYPDATVEGLYTFEGGQTATGSIVEWYRRNFAGEQIHEAQRSNRPVFEILDEQAERVPPGSEGLVCLDYWQGNRCPRKDPRARGVLWGFTLSHGSGHVLRSIYEGTALGTRHLLEDAREHGLAIQRVFAGGGGIQSQLWMQIHADVLGQPIYLTADPQSCALGSAMTAAVNAGHFRSIEDASKSMKKPDRAVEPRPENKGVYGDLYAKYLQTYESLKGLMHAESQG